jgi:teichoic acid transport system ATP-binding protein
VVEFPDRGRLTGAQTYTRVPTVIVDNLHVVYKVHSGAAAAPSPVAALRRIITGSSRRATREVHAVRGVSFVAYEGDAIGLIGTNGSGKSTLLRAIAGLIPPKSGVVYTKRQPSLLSVNAVLLNDLPGEWNVLLGCLAMGMRKSEAQAKVKEIIEFSGINERGDFASLPMRTYSSGMAARLKFSIAAAKTHDVLLIDEALATGDAKFRQRSERRVQELREGAGTVFLVSHDSKAIRGACERTIWLESGVIHMDGPTDEVVDAYEAFVKDPKARARVQNELKEKAAEAEKAAAEAQQQASPPRQGGRHAAR